MPNSSAHSFQYEPIAAAYHYEHQIAREELVLIADIGGGSVFAIIRHVSLVANTK